MDVKRAQMMPAKEKGNILKKGVELKTFMVKNKKVPCCFARDFLFSIKNESYSTISLDTMRVPFTVRLTRYTPAGNSLF